MPDFEIRNEGTVVTVLPLTDAAREWIRENVETEPWQWLGPVLAIDHRCAKDLVWGILDAGLEVG